MVGELDNYYGCPRLDNAYVSYAFYQNEDNEDVYWTDFFDYAVYYPILYAMYGLSDEITLDDLMNDSAMYAGGVFYFEDLDVLDVVEVGDGTRTITITNGTSVVDVVGCEVGELAAKGDMLYYGYFVLICDHGTWQLRPLQSGNYEYLVFYSDVA